MEKGTTLTRFIIEQHRRVPLLIGSAGEVEKAEVFIQGKR